jgi:hypothetical protein
MLSMGALRPVRDGWHLSVGTFVRTTSMPTIYTLPMEAAAFLGRLGHKVSKDHRVPQVRVLASR